MCCAISGSIVNLRKLVVAVWIGVDLVPLSGVPVHVYSIYSTLFANFWFYKDGQFTQSR